MRIVRCSIRINENSCSSSHALCIMKSGIYIYEMQPYYESHSTRLGEQRDICVHISYISLKDRSCHKAITLIMYWSELKPIHVIAIDHLRGSHSLKVYMRDREWNQELYKDPREERYVMLYMISRYLLRIRNWFAGGEYSERLRELLDPDKL